MGSPIPHRNAREKEVDDSHYHESLDDHAVAGATPQPSYPIAFPTIDDSETMVIIIETMLDFPSQSRGGPPHGGPRSSFQTSTSTVEPSPAHSALPDNAPLTTAPSPTFVYPTGGSVSTTMNNNDNPGQGASVQPEKKQSPNKMLPAVAGSAMVVILAIIGLFVFFCLRKRKRQRQVVVEQAKVQEMKARRQSMMLANVGASTTFPMYAAPSSHPAPAGLTAPPPVILGPIVPGSNGAYYTGIDTSDVVSMNDRIVVERTGLGNPFADGDSLNEEPPPPYRPRSFAPMSRDTSFRVPPPSFTTSQTHLIGRQERSPFADPEDDDAISDISGPTRRDHDGMSVVSDMSYQHEPVVTRPTV